MNSIFLAVNKQRNYSNTKTVFKPVRARVKYVYKPDTCIILLFSGFMNALCVGRGGVCSFCILLYFRVLKKSCAFCM